MRKLVPATESRVAFWTSLGGLSLVLVIGLLVGRYPKPGILNPALFWNDPIAQSLLLNLRLPRLLAGVLVGATLGASGAVLQALFANPLVEPGLIGVSQGSAFGATLALVVTGGAMWVVQAFAAVFGGVALVIAYTVARKLRYGGWILRLILAGIAVSAGFSAGVGLLKFVADPLSQLPAITFWLLGGLYSVGWRQLVFVAVPVVTGLCFLWGRRWRLNLLGLHDRVAFSLGAAPARERLIMLGVTAVVTASAIAIAGIVGWVGLLVPHLARRFVGSDTARVLPVAMLLGAGFVVVSDTIARTIVAGEIPLGIVTSLVGASAFVSLLMRGQVAFRK